MTPLIKSSFYDSHDGEVHVARFAAYYKAYGDGQFPPRWAGDLNYRYGSPVFIFYYPLPGTIASAIHTLGINFETTFKLIMILAFFTSSLFFYLWASVLVKKEAAFLGALLYGFAPYHFLNVYVRGDIAEMLGFVFVPLVLLFIELTILKHNIKFSLIGGIFYALLILSHNAISLMFSPIFLIYCLLKIKNKTDIYNCVILLLSGLLLSAFFWIPALVESRYVNGELFIGDMYKNHFPKFQNLIYSNWGFGPDVNKKDGLSPQIGLIHIILSMLSFGLILIRPKFKKEIIYWVAIFILFFFLTLNISSIVWQNMPLLNMFQFPWRLTGVSSFAASVLSIYLFNRYYNKKLFFFMVIILLFSSVQFINIKEIPSKNDEYYDLYKATTDYHGQASTIWTAGDSSDIAKSQFEIINGEAKIINITKKSNIHTATINVKTSANIIDNTIYFPGWQVFVDGKKVPIEFQDINHRGLITFNIPSGIHKIVVIFKESQIRLFSDIISLLSFAILLFVLFKEWLRKIAFVKK